MRYYNCKITKKSRDIKKNIVFLHYTKIIMISKNKIKYIHSLELKKNRKQENLFVAEGPKVVGDLLEYNSAHTLIATKEWLDNNGSVNANEIIEVSDEELRKISFLQHPKQVIGVFNIIDNEININDIKENLCIALDGVQDPGNLGTIIRIADWFGITRIYCSHETADVYNPKVIQATMGSIARVNVMYTDLAALIDKLPGNTPVYGTLLDGNNIYKQKLSDYGLIIMGNEGNGISEAIASRVNNKLLIPNYPPERKTADSLNVAIATAIVCAEFRR